MWFSRNEVSAQMMRKLIELRYALLVLIEVIHVGQTTYRSLNTALNLAVWQLQLLRYRRADRS